MIRNILIFAAVLLVSSTSTAQVSIEKMWVDNRVNPMGITQEQPKFSWSLSSDQRNSFQSAYEIQVAGSPKQFNRSALWQSGRINSDQSLHISYGGQPLKSGVKYYWRVRVWGQENKASEWSAPAFWQMGLIQPEKEFQAKWIIPGFEEDTDTRPSPIFRKEFELSGKKVTQATAYITAHGIYEAHLNGNRIGDAYLTPGWTSYNKRLQYQTYDITELLNKEKNALSVSLGSGWYRGYLAWRDAKNHYGEDIALLLQVDITFSDGSTQSIQTDKSWKTGLGPVIFSEIYDGETYDSRKEQAFSQTGFNDKNWPNAKEADFSKSVVVTTINEPIRRQEVFRAKSIFTTPKGELIADFGQNLVGFVQLKASGSAGTKIEIYHAEVLDKNGNFYIDNLREAKQKTTYILNGQGKQTLEPHFTFQGFRYAKVVGYPGTLKAEDIQAVVLHSDVEQSGHFSTSDALLNQLQHNIQWSQKGNFLDVPTDCPQRDERMGWTGDAQAFFRTAAFNSNVNNFFVKWLKDLAADQYENGSVPFVIPNILDYDNGSILRDNSAGSAGWADAATIIPWERYLIYGDEDILREQYPSMKAWVEYMYDQSENYVWNTGFHFGDWLFYSPDDDRMGKAAVTDKYYITQCFFAYSTQLLIEAAKVLGYEQDVQLYNERLVKIKDAFLNEYVSPAGRIGPNTQTAYVLALQFNLLPEHLRQQAADRLVKNVIDYEYHLSTGFLGTPYLCHVLSRYGHDSIAFKLLNQTTFPSWLYPVTMGATTIWERWDGIKPDSSFQTPAMNSFNHYAYGAIGDWMYRNIAGINLVKPAYKEFYIKPKTEGLSYAEGTLNTYYGLIKSSWKKENGQFKLEVRIPVNTTAIVFLPARSSDDIFEGEEKLDAVKGIKLVNTENGHVQLQLGSGEYQFLVRE